MKLTKEDKNLIKEAKDIIVKSSAVNLNFTGEVGSALLTTNGNIFRGVCIGYYCGLASCGEYQAIGAMISNGEKHIKTIVAVWLDDKTNRYKVIPPCGKCREMIKQTSKKNMNTYVIISETKKVTLKELLPHPWGGSLED